MPTMRVMQLFDRSNTTNSSSNSSKKTASAVHHSPLKQVLEEDLDPSDASTETMMSLHESTTTTGSGGVGTTTTAIVESPSIGLRERAPSDVEALLVLPTLHSSTTPARRPTTTNRRSGCLDCLQISNRRVPNWLSRRLHGTTNTTTYYWMEGWTLMWHTGRPAAEVVSIAGIRPPRYLFYMISGGLCDVLQICSLFCLHTIIPHPTLCWVIGFLCSIPCRHVSHRWLVFGDYVNGYYRSLARMYAAYSVIIVLSTLFNAVLSASTKLPVTASWILTLLWTGLANYFILKYCWNVGSAPVAPAINRDS